LKTGWVTSGA